MYTRSRRVVTQGHRGCSLILVAGLLIGLGMNKEVQAQAFTNLSQTYVGNYVAGDEVGNAILVGIQDVLLGSITISERSFGPATGEFLTIRARNNDGTVGSVLFSSFTPNYDSMTGMNTFTANTPYNLVNSTGYWVVMNSTTPGDINAAPAWDYTPSTFYTSNGITLPLLNTSYYTFGLGDTNHYADLSDGPQLFQITAAVPEPGPLALAFTATALGLVSTRIAKRLRSKLPQDGR